MDCSNVGLAMAVPDGRCSRFAEIDPLAPYPADYSCIPPQNYFPKNHERPFPCLI